MVSSCIFVAFIKDMDRELRAIQQSNETKGSSKTKGNKLNMDNFLDFVEFHSAVKELRASIYISSETLF